MKLIARISIILVFSVLTAGCLSAQSALQADRYWNDLAYVKSSEAYAKLLKKDPKNPLYLKRAANSFYETGDFKVSSRFFASLERAGELEGDDVFTYFQILLMLNNDVEAKRVLDQNLANASDSELYPVLNTWKQDFLQRESLKDGVYDIDFLDVPINSKQADFAPTFYGDGIVFASSRPNPTKKASIFEGDGASFLDLYFAKLTENGEFSKVLPFDAEVNTEYHDGPVVFSSDGQTMYISRSFYKAESSKKIKGDKNGVVNTKIQVVNKDENDKWTKITEFPYNDPSNMVAHAAISADGQTMVYASNQQDGYGRSDLYVCTGDEYGWSEPVNLGSYINTAGEELFPSINSDGDLFFSSNGLLGLGGLDVFMVQGFLSGARDVVNIGAPVNSAYDDFGMVYDFNKKIGFFSSNREGGLGSDDIYQFRFKATAFKVLAYNCESTAANPELISGATVKVDDLSDVFILETATDGKGIGEVKLATQDIKITLQADGYLDTSVVVPMSDFEKYVDNPLKIAICKEPVLPPPTDLEIAYSNLDIPSNLNINFDLDSWDITDEAAYKLDQVFDIMMNPKYIKTKASLAAHTDSRGQDEYNEWLSWKRAWSTIKYLMIKGLSFDRLYGIGYGERRLMNQCANGVRCSESNHRENRRVEITNMSEENPEIAMLTLSMNPFDKPQTYYTVEVLVYSRLVGSKSKDKDTAGYAHYIKKGSKYHHMIGYFKTREDAAKFMEQIGFKSPKIRFVQNGTIQ